MLENHRIKFLVKELGKRQRDHPEILGGLIDPRALERFPGHFLWATREAPSGRKWAILQGKCLAKAFAWKLEKINK